MNGTISSIVSKSMTKYAAEDFYESIKYFSKSVTAKQLS